VKPTIVTIAGILVVTTSLFASVYAEKVFDSKCVMCHIKTIPTDSSNMVAPALFGVMRHVKMAYPNREDAVDFMVDYVQNPSKEKAICMPQKIARFGLMPSQKANISPKELKEVAEWMFDNYPPTNFRGRGSIQGMQNRPIFAMFDINGDGKITQDEFNAFQSSRMNSRMNSNMNRGIGSGGMGRMQNHSTFADFDLNKDGVIVKDELLSVRADKQAKRATQGYPMRNAANAPAFESMDSNGDGKITQKELTDFQMSFRRKN